MFCLGYLQSTAAEETKVPAIEELKPNISTYRSTPCTLLWCLLGWLATQVYVHISTTLFNLLHCPDFFSPQRSSSSQLPSLRSLRVAAIPKYSSLYSWLIPSVIPRHFLRLRRLRFQVAQDYTSKSNQHRYEECLGR